MLYTYRARGALCLGFVLSLLTAAARGDTLYVGNADGTIDTVSPEGTVSPFVQLPINRATEEGATGLAFDAVGNLYAATHSGLIAGSSVFKITPTGTVSRFVTGLTTPTSLAIDRTGNLFVSDEIDQEIFRINPLGVVSPFARLPREAEGLAFDRNGTLYAAVFEDGTIYQISPAGTVSIFVNSGQSTLVDLAFDSGGNLYCSNDGGAVVKVTADKHVSVFATGFNQAFDEALDSQGNLYVTNPGSSGPIYKVGPAGGVAVPFVNSGAINPISIVAQVPEPSSLMLLVIFLWWGITAGSSARV